MKKTDGLEILPKPRKKCLTPGTVAYFFAQFPAGRDEGLNYARLAAERSEHVRRFLEAYDGLPEHRRQLSIFDRLCREAEVSVFELIGAITLVAQTYNAHLTKLDAALHIPKTMEASRAAAGLPEGFQDRRMQGEIAGVIEPKKGTSVSVEVKATAQAGVPARGLPHFEEDLMDSMDIIRGREQRQLQAARSEAIEMEQAGAERAYRPAEHRRPPFGGEDAA